MLAARIRLLIVTLWVGSMWTIGYVVAPTLFAALHDRVLAGTIAGKLFQVEAWLSVACSLVLILLVRLAANDQNGNARKRLTWVLAAMLICTLVGYFGLQPFMATLREAAGPGGVMESGAKAQFGMLHGASSALYLIQSLLGAVLVLKIR